VGLRALGIGPMGSLVAAGVLDPTTRIVIADFDARGADTTLAGVVTEAFRIDFARSTFVRPAEPTAIREVLRRMQRPDVERLDPELAREIALRAGIGAYITGEVAAAGGGFVLTARVIAAESGEVLAAFREQAHDEADVIRAIDRLSRSLRERTGESLKAIRRSQPLEQVTTESLEALQKYTRGIRATGWDGDAARGTRLLEEAVALDSAFAAAHRALAIAHSNRDEPELALASIERALRFQDRLTDLERELAYGSYHSIRGEHAQSVAAYERVLEINPQYFAALNNLALEHEMMFDYARAEEYLRRAIEADTGRFFGYTNLGELLVFAGRFDEARQAFDAAVARAPESAWPVVNRALVPLTQGDYDEAEARLRRLIDDATTGRALRDRADVRLTHLLMLRGRLAEAESRVEALARVNGDPGAVERRVASHRFDTGMWIRRDPERARGVLRQAHALVSDSADAEALVGIATACAVIGDVACARESLTRAGRTGPLHPWTSMDVFTAEGAIALAEQDFARALRMFRSIRDRRCPRCEDALVGQVFERMEQPDSAIAAYELYLATPAVDRIFVDAYHRAFVLERLGALYEQRNDRPNAARHYAQLAALWEDADAELQPRVAEANRRLRLLQPDR
jgi:tetratricopeptide (TPR) repeat protein